MAKHKHYDVIVAWAEGKQIQTLSNLNIWVNVVEPRWEEGAVYRVKPEPKPDVLKTIVIDGYKKESGWEYKLQNMLWDGEINNPLASGVIHVTLDGETGKLKTAKVVQYD